MILSAQSIRKRCLENDLIWPFAEGALNERGLSFGLSSASYDVRSDVKLVLFPHGCALGSTIEKFVMPLDLAMAVRDKSTWARRFVTVQNTHVDPGWRGYLTLEIINHSSKTWTIERGDPIAQVIFEVLDEPTEQPYVGKYQNQEAGPQSPREQVRRTGTTPLTVEDLHPSRR